MIRAGSTINVEPALYTVLAALLVKNGSISHFETACWGNNDVNTVISQAESYRLVTALFGADKSAGHIIE